jgi:SAM-dependent methyltransferase
VSGTRARPRRPAARRRAPKRYDRDYFDRWYRRSRLGLGRVEFVRRKVALAVAAAEYVLQRPLRSVLDVGCGEAPWRAPLRRLRPGVRYLGVDSSEYVVRRFGKRRNIRRGSLRELDRMRLGGPFDLVVCSDVLHYVATADVRRGLRALKRTTRGILFIEAFTAGDDLEGDDHEFQRRSLRTYRRLFRRAGLIPLGLHLYLPWERGVRLVELELTTP